MTIEFGDCRETMRRWHNAGVRAQTCVTSPPYFGLRDYGHEGQFGLESSPQKYIDNMVEVFRCVRNILVDDGTLWLNIGDSYASSKHASNNSLKAKDLIGIPWMLAFALRADGWYLRQDIIWSKPNPMPESVRDRCTKAHEYVFLLSKSAHYFYDCEAIMEPTAPSTFSRLSQNVEQQRGSDRVPGKTNGPMKAVGRFDKRNRRSVWTITTQPYRGAHFATFPTALVEPCVLAGSRSGDVVLDPFMGSGTTAQVAIQLGRRYLGCELVEGYGALQRRRLEEAAIAKAKGEP